MAIKGILTAGGDTTAIPAGNILEIVSSGPISATTRTTNGVSTVATLPITKGKWILIQSTSCLMSPGSADNWIAASTSFYRDGVKIQGTQSEMATDELAASVTIGLRSTFNMFYIHDENSASATITLRFEVTINNAGTPTTTLNPNGADNGRAYAIRIG
jgi:hypothetical protein